MASLSPLSRDGSDRDDDAAELAGHTLAFAAAACQLAKDIWLARRRAYDEPRGWRDLSPVVRQRRVMQAAWVLTLQKEPYEQHSGGTTGDDVGDASGDA